MIFVCGLFLKAGLCCNGVLTLSEYCFHRCVSHVEKWDTETEAVEGGGASPHLDEKHLGSLSLSLRTWEALRWHRGLKTEAPTHRLTGAAWVSSTYFAGRWWLSAGRFGPGSSSSWLPVSAAWFLGCFSLFLGAGGPSGGHDREEGRFVLEKLLRSVILVEMTIQHMKKYSCVIKWEWKIHVAIKVATNLSDSCSLVAVSTEKYTNIIHVV